MVHPPNALTFGAQTLVLSAFKAAVSFFFIAKTALQRLLYMVVLEVSYLLQFTNEIAFRQKFPQAMQVGF